MSSLASPPKNIVSVVYLKMATTAATYLEQFETKQEISQIPHIHNSFTQSIFH